MEKVNFSSKSDRALIYITFKCVTKVSDILWINNNTGIYDGIFILLGISIFICCSVYCFFEKGVKLVK